MATASVDLSNMIAAGNVNLDIRINHSVLAISAMHVPMLNGWVARVNSWSHPIPLASLDGEVYPTADVAVSMAVQALLRHLAA